MAKRLKLKKRLIQDNSLPNLLQEKRAQGKGYKCIAGIDEVGRGPLAGPVMAACVVLKRFDFTVRIDDSKRLTPALREKAYAEIIERADVGIGMVFEDIIEEINIHNATILAMERALSNLSITPDLLLIDGISKLKLPIEQICIIGGDGKCLSIACASIIAKVTRDRLMTFYDNIFPQYGFLCHKGYGTAKHFKAIKEHGLLPLHRRSFIH